MKKTDRLILKNIKKIYRYQSQNVRPYLSARIQNGIIRKIAPYEEIEKECLPFPFQSDEILDCSRLIALPGFVDSHTHLLFAGSRENEFYMRAAGAEYLDIHKKGGGIYSTVQSVRNASEEELLENGLKWLNSALHFGTTTVEIKSGYGLDYKTERKMLKVINRLNDLHAVDIIPTFLVHTVPRDKNRGKYLDEVANRMTPEFREFTDWFDLFLEKEVFDLSEAESLIRKAKDSGYHVGLHANQMNDIGGVKLALETGVRHVDHLEVLDSKDAERIIAHDDIYPVFLPSAEYHTFSEKTGQLQILIDAFSRIVLATDFNPGTSPVLSPAAIMCLAVLRYRISDPRLLLDAFTQNPADMLFLPDRGRIREGAKADILLFELDNFEQIPYFGTIPFIRYVIKNGSLVEINR